MRFEGKRVVITAGGSGIGAAFVRRFKAEGAQVAYCDLDPGEVPEGVLGLSADVTDEAQMAAFFARVEERLGGVDVLCANAGTGGPAAPIQDMDFGPWRDCIAANLDGAFLSVRWAAQHMIAQKSGSIVLTSSTSGQWGVPTRSPYVAASWAFWA